MSQFHALFSVGIEVDAVQNWREISYKQSETLLRNLKPEQASHAASLVAEFAKRELGLVVIDPRAPVETALRTTSYPVDAEEDIRWDKPLFDSDGYEHTLISLGGIEVVTKHSFAYAVWNRKTGVCQREGCSEMTISNTPMSEEVREARRAAAGEILADLHAQAAIDNANRPRG